MKLVRRFATDQTARRWACAAGLGAWLLVAGPAAACSLGPWYQPPTNYDLVKTSPYILRVKAVAAYAGNADEPWKDPATVTLEVQEVIKGHYTPRTLTVEGDGYTYDGASDAHSFSLPRPGAGRGACNAYDYRIGTSYVILLNELPAPPHPRVDGPAFSRINEEAPEYSPWLTTVKHYARISELNNPQAEQHELRALQAQVKAHPGDWAYPPELIRDIDSHLRTPTPFKSYAELMAFYRQPGASAELKKKALWAMASAPKPEARPMFERLARQGVADGDIASAGEFASSSQDRALAHLLMARLPTLHDANRRRLVLETAVRTLDDRDLPLLLRTLSTVNQTDLRTLEPWVTNHPSPAAKAMLKQRLKPDYANEDWRANDDAAAGDAGVVRWAERQLASRDGVRQPAYGVLGRSPLPRADALARRVIRQGDDYALLGLMLGYTGSSNPNASDRLADIAARPNRSPAVSEWLMDALDQRAKAGDVKAAQLLAIIKREAADPAP